MSDGAPTAEGLECPSCGRANPDDARFCAGCGHRFGVAETTLGEDDGGADPLLGRTVADRYRIEELLGRGGMGVVYRVEHVRIGKLMAMKLLHGALARDKDVVKRFKREAEAVSKLDHPNTVQIFDFGQSEGMMYLVMEYLSGGDLGHLLKAEGSLPFARVARIAAQVAGSVAQAHDRGIVHRDLKPENVMVMAEGPVEDYVKVLDFGLAKLREHEDADRSITRAGSILGTPYYMAPEHIRGEDVDARSDVYAMGALIYKCVTGVPPFWATTPVGVLTMHLTDDVVPPSERAPGREIPFECDRIVLKAMEKSAANRYQSMQALRADLIEYLDRVGEADGIESSRLARVSRMPMETRSGRQREVATRGDVDDYERSLRRKSLLSWIFVVLAAAGVTVGGVWLWLHRPSPPRTVEVEPNDELASANPLPEGQEVTGYLGARIDEDRSDADVYLLRNPGAERRAIRIDVSAIPNMDLTVELYRSGLSTPILVSDGGAMGLPESIANFVVDGSAYYVRVREIWESGRRPTENVSDPYVIRWQRVETNEGDEREVNDSLELGEPIAPGQERRGWIGWGGDVDVYCLSESAPFLRARVEPIQTLDLVLEVVDRRTGRVLVVDDNRHGAGEASPAEPAEAERTCYQVRAIRPKDGIGNDPDRPYVLHVERAEPAEIDGGP